MNSTVGTTQDIHVLMNQIALEDPTTRKKGAGRRTKEAAEWVQKNSITGGATPKGTWEIDHNLPKIVFVYERISDLRDDSDTFERQREGILALAEREGIDLTGAIFLGEEGSAYHSKHRPEFEKMIKTIESFPGHNQIIVIASELTRLFRNRDVAYRVLGILRHKKVQLRICNNPSLDINNPAFDMILPILIEVAQGETAATSYRTSGGMKIRAKRGEYRGGTIPFGMTTEKRQNEKGEKSYLCPNYAVREDYPKLIQTGVDGEGNPILSESHIKTEVDLVKEIFNRYEAGDPLSTLTRWVNAQGFPTPMKGADGSWTEQNIRRILLNPHYTGRVVHKKKVVVDENGNGIVFNEAIISDLQFASVAARIESRYRPVKRYNAYALSGLLVCPVCGNKLNGRPGSSTSRPTYGCRTHYYDKDKCPSPNLIAARGIEQYVYDILSELAEQKPQILRELAKPAELIDVNSDRRQELQRKLEALDAQLATEKDELEREGIKHKKSIVAKQIADLAADAYAARMIAKAAFEGAAQFKQIWDSGDKAHLSFALRTVIDKIVISPSDRAPRLNSHQLKALGWTANLHRITIHWANGTVMNMADPQAAMVQPAKAA